MRMAAGLALMLAAVSAPAATQFGTGTFTWDDGLTAAWSTNSGGPYNSVWTPGNDGVLEGFRRHGQHRRRGRHRAQPLLYEYHRLSRTEQYADAERRHADHHGGSGLAATINSIIAGSAGLAKSGTGTLTLTGANTYTGGTVINANSGTLTTTNTSTTTPGLGTGAIVMGAGSTLNIYGTYASAPTFANTFSGAGTLKHIFNSTQNLTMNNVTGVSGTIQLSRTGSNTSTWSPSAGTYAGALILDQGIVLNVGNVTFTKGITVAGNGTTAAITPSGTLGGKPHAARSVTFNSQVNASTPSGGGAIIAGNVTSGAGSGTQILYMYNGSDYHRAENFSGNISDGGTGGKISVYSNTGANDHLATLERHEYL